jgi:FkbH-like protein
MVQTKALLISDFTLSNFSGYLANDASFPEVVTVTAPFGQVMQTLLDDRSECWKTEPDIAVVWTQAAAVVDGFNKLLQFEHVEVGEILEQVDAYCASLNLTIQRVKWLFIPTWSLPSNYRGLGAFDLQANGAAYTLMQMNRRLVENLSKISNCIILDTQKWIAATGEEKSFNPKLWYLSKIPFSNAIFKRAVGDIKTALRALAGKARKLVILDLDDTLWGGVVGDIGWQQLKLGGHDPTGEALVDFQKDLRALKNRGIVLAVVSKNDETVALEAIRNHPEMVLKEEDFAAWKINWRDKAENIVELISELNLGFDSAVFIDDNPVERARVREALPDVLVPEWPEDKLLYRQALCSLDCFDSALISSEDRRRSDMYKAEHERTMLRQAIPSAAAWLESLNTKVIAEALSAENLARVAQLLNKTNQMNLTTRRIAPAELLAWCSADRRQLFAFRVTDKFGDSGLTGVLSLEAKGDAAHLIDFVLSCRVMGREVEEMMISHAASYARSLGLKRLWMQYVPTAKNKPCLEFLQRSRLKHDFSGSFYFDLSEDYPMPPHIEMIDRAQCAHSAN